MNGPPAPTVVVLMGVAGSGKTTIGERLAVRLDAVFAEGDAYHPPANVAKMSAGQPLDDADRLPWLQALSAAIGGWLAEGQRTVLACSALRRRYRDILVAGRPGIAIVYLKGSQALIGGRLQARRGHFMPPTLLPRQFAALEEPAAEEAVVTVDVAGTPDQIVDAILARLGAYSPA